MPVYPTKGWKSAQPSFGFGRRQCREGIIGPGVFGIAASELFFDFKIGRPPEAGQVLRDLNRPARWREEVQHDRNFSIDETGRVLAAEQFL